MTTPLNDASIKHAFERKKESCKKRLIEFDLPYEYYYLLMKNRSNMRCFYTQKLFDTRKTTNDMYPSLERINNNAGYTVENTVLVSSKVNKLKANIIENEMSMKGLPEGDVFIIQRVRKMMNNPTAMKEGMKPYEDLASKVVSRQEEVQEKAERKEARKKVITEQEVKLNAEKLAEAKKVAAKAKFEQQLHLAEHYTRTFKKFESIDQVFEVTIKEFRDMMRITRCSFSKVEFKTLEDKYVWVIDKSKPITKDNCKIVMADVANAIDFLSKGDNIKLETIMKNVLKSI